MTLVEFMNHAKKFLAAILGVVAIALAQGLIEGTAAKWSAIIISVATALGVYVVPNILPGDTTSGSSSDSSSSPSPPVTPPAS
jgi:hypothetical protein